MGDFRVLKLLCDILIGLHDSMHLPKPTEVHGSRETTLYADFKSYLGGQGMPG